MARPKPETPPAPQPLPRAGGAWIRQADGTLIRDPAEHPPEAVQTPAEATLKGA
jgi:hypothetical protein